MMRKLLLILLSASSIAVNAQKFTFSGMVKDSLSGEALIGAYIWIPAVKAGCSTNAYGFYSITLPQGTYAASFSYLGYSTKTITIKLYSPLTENIELQEKSVSLNEVTVKGESPNRNVTSSEMSTQMLDIKEIRSIPVLLGEQDIMKTLQLLPGDKICRGRQQRLLCPWRNN